jgi:hypothetical protein
MTRSCKNFFLLAVISLFSGVIWLSPATATAAPTILPLGQITEGLRGPTMLDLDAAGNLYVADSRNKTVVKFDQYGDKVAVLAGAEASGAGLAVAPDGRVFVAAGNAVAILDAAGELLGYLGGGAGEFQFAGDIDFDVNGNIYVVDQTAGHIKLFAPGAGAGSVFGGLQFGGNIGLSIDASTNLIYVTNYNVNKAAGVLPSLHVYDAGGVLQKTLAAADGCGAQIFAFGDVVFDGAGYCYLSDFSQGTIRILDAKTDALLLNYGLGAVNHPGSMAYDAATKRLFVLHGDSRVDVYGIDGGTSPVRANRPPTTPQAVTVGELASLTPGLVFGGSSDADGDALKYNIRVLDAAGTRVFSTRLDGAASQATATVSQPLVENGRYSWQAQADDGRLTSAWSAPKAIYINARQEAPAAPQLTSLVSGESAGGAALLAWSASADADPFASVKYRVEIFDGAATVASQIFAGTSSVVAGFSSVLTPGAPYAWRVTAIDNTSLEAPSINTGRFVFSASLLKVSANVAGARVYLGGHHGYAGRYLGEAPLEIRDLDAGNYALVVEAAGFEPFVQTVTLAKDAATEVTAALAGASLAGSFAVHDLTLAGKAVKGGNVAPILADLDQDGTLDLLLAADGYLNFFKGSLVADPQVQETFEYQRPAAAGTEAPAINRVVFKTRVKRLSLPMTAGAAPCLVDWNNDDRLDLLVGAADGSVKLYLGEGPLKFAAAGEWLVTVDAQAVPAVSDFDGDGDKDLIVSAGNSLLLFDNVGSDAAPVLNTQETIAVLSNASAPLFLDWDADGSRDLLLLSQGELMRAVVANKVVTSLQSTGLKVAEAGRVFAFNHAGRNYADLVFATASGALVVANGELGEFSPAYVDAMLVKLADLELKLLEQAPGLAARTLSLAGLLEQKGFAAAGTQAVQLIAELDYATQAWDAAVEFAGLLDPAGAAAQVAAQTAAAQAAAN